jgi:hypothetical protein
MTYSIREQILAAIATALTNTTQVSTRIYRSRVEAFSRSEAPALVIEPGTDELLQEVSTCKYDWRLTVTVAVYTRGGTIPDQTADPIVVDVHARLMADRTLGGLAMDVIPISVDPTFEGADQVACWTVMSFAVRYRTSVTSITSQ